MTYQEAIEALAADPHVWRYRELVESENPRVRDAWRERVIRMAGGEPKPKPIVPAYPSFAKQAWNASKAAVGFAASGFAVASQEEQARRLAICQAPCSEYDAGQGRCRKCGCGLNLKTRLAAAHCPISKW